MSKPKRTCFGKGICLHIGPCCDFWADDGMCVCNPVDAAEYPYSQRLYVAGNIHGFSSPNIRTIFPDGGDHVHTFDRGDYVSVWWSWSGGYKKITFQLRDGDTVRASISTRIMGPNDCSVEGERRKPIDCPSGKKIFREVCRDGKWVPSNETCPNKVEYKGVTLEWVYLPAAGRSEWGYWDDEFCFASFGPDLETAKSYIDRIRVCAEGEKRYDETCWNNSVIQKEVCCNNRWVATGEKCPPIPMNGALRKPTTCWDGSVIYAERFDANIKWWVATGEKCPPVPMNGALRKPTTCWDGSVIYAERFNAAQKRWIPTGDICPTKPECIPGDKKAGYVCKNGKWQAVPEPAVEPTVPEPVVEPTAPKPAVEPTVQEPENEGTCYINFDIPLLDMLPGLPCKWWLLPIPPGFKKTNKK